MYAKDDRLGFSTYKYFNCKRIVFYQLKAKKQNPTVLFLRLLDK